MLLLMPWLLLMLPAITMLLLMVLLCGAAAVQLNEALEKLKAGKPRYRIVMETDI